MSRVRSESSVKKSVFQTFAAKPENRCPGESVLLQSCTHYRYRQACRQASRLLALLVAIMVYPLAHELAVLESQQGAPVYSLASVL